MKLLKTLAVTLALAAAASAASAQDGLTLSFADTLVAKQGYREVSEGLFARITDDETLYVAHGSAGNLALRAKLVEEREKLNLRAIKETGKPAPSIIKYDEMIAQLSIPQNKNQSNYGDCNGNPNSQMLHATAQAWMGVIANAYASNSNGKVNTTNFAHAWTTNRPGTITSEQFATTYGTTPASATASASSFRACDAHAWATITCPGMSSPSVTAFAHHVAFVNCQV